MRWKESGRYGQTGVNRDSLLVMDDLERGILIGENRDRRHTRLNIKVLGWRLKIVAGRVSL